MWLPLTLKPPLLPVTTPAEVLPSPQVMTAVNAAAPSVWSGVVKVATVPLKGAPAVAPKLAAAAASGAAVTVSVPLTGLKV